MDSNYSTNPCICVCNERIVIRRTRATLKANTRQRLMHVKIIIVFYVRVMNQVTAIEAPAEMRTGNSHLEMFIWILLLSDGYRCYTGSIHMRVGYMLHNN